MSLKVYDSKDAIPETLRDSAIETKDGKWAAADVDGLKTSQQRLLDEKKKLQQEFDTLRGQLGGLSPEEVAKMRDDRKRAEDEAARKAGDFDKLLEKRLAEQKAEFDRQLGEVLPYRQRYQERELEIAIRDAAAKAGVIATDVPFVLDIVKDRRIKYDEKTGKPVVVDRDGDPTGLTVEKFFAETFKAEAPKFYQAAGGSGGGAGSSAGGSHGNGTPTITDNAAFLANVDKIAKGELKVGTP